MANCYNADMAVGKMNQYVTGAIIKELREKNKMTQLQLYPEGNAQARKSYDL